MNFLAHAWLARGGSQAFVYGNLIADGVKGVDLSSWQPPVARGIRHHRRVDAFVDRHSVVREARNRAPAQQRRHAGIALDLVWDHFLAASLDVAARDALVKRCYRLLGGWGAPNRLSPMVPCLIGQDWLRGYADFDFTCRAIAGLGRRLSGPNHLEALIPWLHSDYLALSEGFRTLRGDLDNVLSIPPVSASL
ncbi:ACP phosphodiesterase [Halomonas sp. 18H]|uniref:acyl carrier protein phosphodiesterase n=1 Tax=Halomonas almeriensis TaxID=308163 RepID=UPI00222F936E|nr:MULTISPECIES: ACP phosphodiesterase [Halomonas]MCW4151896.1 ACP phosphodiesterase [Halomonas sp. 18H]MDN3554142.1 ACP phosphodiesterase [Halomonas almeriensis]